ncbi:MAG: type II toxin-antitoxin system VapB family antitoxin [Planctomycetes bacterium]|nr:type II toxin-antitoxin system VapB family antitoxin [Planctomycetota bacterium]
MRTSIDLDDKLVRQAMRLTGLRTKRAVVEEALRALIRGRDSLAGDREYKARLARYVKLYKDLEPEIARTRVSEPASVLIRRMRDGTLSPKR